MTIRSVVAVATFAFASTVAAFSQATPAWVEITEKIDWGKIEVPASGYLEEKLFITNTGKQVVKVVEVRPGCGCTKTEPDKLELKPGEKSTVGIKLNISPSQMGDISKAVTVRVAQGSDTISKIVMLHANISRLLRVSPNQYLPMNDLEVGKASVAKATITNEGTKPVTLSDVVMNGGLTANVKNGQVLKPGEVLEINITVTPMAEGSQSGTLNFKGTDGSKSEDFIVSTYGTVKGPGTAPQSKSK